MAYRQEVVWARRAELSCDRAGKSAPEDQNGCRTAFASKAMSSSVYLCGFLTSISTPWISSIKLGRTDRSAPLYAGLS